MATTVVSGANRGIGLELCRLCAERGDRVIALCRQTSTGLDELGVQVEEGIDISDDAVVEVLAERLAGVAIDLLINNAGVLSVETLDHLDWAGMRRQFEVNSLGPLRVTSALLPGLSEGSKIAIITSRMGSIADNTSGSRYGYRMSKAAVNMAGVSLARDCSTRGIAVALLHPGWIRTRMTKGTGNATPDQAATGLLARIDALTLETSGGFWHAEGHSLPW